MSKWIPIKCHKTQLMKTMAGVILTFTLLLGLGGCKSAQSVVFSDDIRALVELPGGEVLSIDVERWNTRSGLYKITAKDGRQYIVAFTRCVLIGEKEDEA